MGDKYVVEKLLEKLVKICEFLVNMTNGITAAQEVYYTYGSIWPRELGQRAGSPSVPQVETRQSLVEKISVKTVPLKVS